MKNIGPTIAIRLNKIGNHSLTDLHHIGAANAFLKIKQNNPGIRILVCYYLYTLEGA